MIFNKKPRYNEGQSVEEFQDSLRKRLREQYASRKTKDTFAMIGFFILAGVSFILVMLTGMLWYFPLICLGLGFTKMLTIRRLSRGKHKDENYDKTFEIKDDFDWNYYESGQDIIDKQKSEEEKRKEIEENGGF